MTDDINTKLEDLNIQLDEASTPAGSYVPYVISNNLVFISGQLPFINGQLTIKGKVGDTVSIEMFDKEGKSIFGQISQKVVS